MTITLLQDSLDAIHDMREEISLICRLAHHQVRLLTPVEHQRIKQLKEHIRALLDQMDLLG